jgi:hypothetical protein
LFTGALNSEDSGAVFCLQELIKNDKVTLGCCKADGKGDFEHEEFLGRISGSTTPKIKSAEGFRRREQLA